MVLNSTIEDAPAPAPGVVEGGGGVFWAKAAPAASDRTADPMIALFMFQTPQLNDCRNIPEANLAFVGQGGKSEGAAASCRPYSHVGLRRQWQKGRWPTRGFAAGDVAIARRLAILRAAPQRARSCS
jgi:hypothetical protein